MKPIVAFLVLAAGLSLTGCGKLGGPGRPARQTFDSWLAQQPAEVQEHIWSLQPQIRDYYIMRGPAGWAEMARQGRHVAAMNRDFDRRMDEMNEKLREFDRSGP
jgi:hypothetical protein